MNEQQAFLAALIDPKTQQKAFRELVVRYQKPLYVQIRSIVINHDDTDDVLQNTFVKVFQNLAKFKGESKLYSWIYRIATNEAITHLQQKAKKHHTTSQEHQERQLEKLVSDVDYCGDAMAIKLQCAVAKLPEKQQLVFQMKYYQEMKYEEISEILGTSVGALKANYFHAVKKIEEFVTRD